MVRIALLSVVLLSATGSFAQTLPPERLTAWDHAGLTTEVHAPENMVSILDHGADPTGASSSNTAYVSALQSLNGHAGTIYFPEGEYLFTSSLNVTDSVFLKGESQATVLHFNLENSGNLILLNGSVIPTEFPLASDGIKGTYELELADAGSLEQGDVIWLSMDDEDLMFSEWAYGTMGQIVEITMIDGDLLTLADPLNHHYPIGKNAFVRKLNPVRAAGIECLVIRREDNEAGQQSNIYMNACFNCAVRNIESYRCDFGHVEVNISAHVLVEKSYFHHAIGYGGGGQGYGVIFQFASSFCLGQNNIFNHLRHSMLLQSGANGNVFGYNFSMDPHWESGVLPANSAGEAVLHGNYPFMNLFEGNSIQNIVVDASHGSSGPYNTFFRNRAALWGFFSDATTQTDSMNVIGNEITNSNFPYGMFSINGNGHYSFGNNVNGNVTPQGTEGLSMNSLYLDENDLPAFLEGQTLPMIGFPLDMNEKTLPSEDRYDNGEPVSCAGAVVSTNQAIADEAERTYVSGRLLRIGHELLPAMVIIYAADGSLVERAEVSSSTFRIPRSVRTGMFVIRIDAANGQIESIKLAVP